MKITKFWIITIFIMLLLSGGGLAYYLNKDTGFKEAQPASKDEINLEPPTEEEKNSGDQQKEKIIEEQNTRNNDGQSQGSATVIITDAGQYDNVIEVRSFIPNHYEDGTCTIKFSQNGKTFSKNTPAYRDVSTTICTNPLIKRSEFSSGGDWQVVVSYKSPGASGTSEAKTIRIK